MARIGCLATAAIVVDNLWSAAVGLHWAAFFVLSSSLTPLDSANAYLSLLLAPAVGLVSQPVLGYLIDLWPASLNAFLIITPALACAGWLFVLAGGAMGFPAMYLAGLVILIFAVNGIFIAYTHLQVQKYHGKRWNVTNSVRVLMQLVGGLVAHVLGIIVTSALPPTDALLVITLLPAVGNLLAYMSMVGLRMRSDVKKPPEDGSALEGAGDDGDEEEYREAVKDPIILARAGTALFTLALMMAPSQYLSPSFFESLIGSAESGVDVASQSFAIAELISVVTVFLQWMLIWGWNVKLPSISMSGILLTLVSGLVLAVMFTPFGQEQWAAMVAIALTGFPHAFQLYLPFARLGEQAPHSSLGAWIGFLNVFLCLGQLIGYGIALLASSIAVLFGMSDSEALAIGIGTSSVAAIFGMAGMAQMRWRPKTDGRPLLVDELFEVPVATDDDEVTVCVNLVDAKRPVNKYLPANKSYFQGAWRRVASHCKVAATVPIYNEEANELYVTLDNLITNAEQSLQGPDQTDMDLHVMVIMDGWTKASLSAKFYLMRMFGIVTEQDMLKILYPGEDEDPEPVGLDNHLPLDDLRRSKHMSLADKYGDLPPIDDVSEEAEAQRARARQKRKMWKRKEALRLERKEERKREEAMSVKERKLRWMDKKMINNLTDRFKSEWTEEERKRQYIVRKDIFTGGTRGGNSSIFLQTTLSTNDIAPIDISLPGIRGGVENAKAHARQNKQARQLYGCMPGLEPCGGMRTHDVTKDGTRRLKVTLMIKGDNRKKHNSHEWFLQVRSGFCAVYRPDYAFATDCATLFERKCLKKLVDYMNLHPDCSACTGRQRVKTPFMQTGEQWDGFIGMYFRAVQRYDFDSAFLCYMGAFALTGFLPVIPGPCGLYRWSLMSAGPAPPPPSDNVFERTGRFWEEDPRLPEAPAPAEREEADEVVVAVDAPAVGAGEEDEEDDETEYGPVERPTWVGRTTVKPRLGTARVLAEKRARSGSDGLGSARMRDIYDAFGPPPASDPDSPYRVSVSVPAHTSAYQLPPDADGFGVERHRRSIPSTCAPAEVPVAMRDLSASAPKPVNKRSALEWYFDVVNSAPSDTEMVIGTLKIAEDRVLSASSVLKTRTACHMGLVPEAEFYFDAELEMRSLVLQRRRWLNGTAAGYFYFAWDNVREVFRAKTPLLSRVATWLMLCMQLIIYFVVAVSPAVFLSSLRVASQVLFSPAHFDQTPMTVAWFVCIALYVLFVVVHATYTSFSAPLFVILHALGAIAMLLTVGASFWYLWESIFEPDNDHTWLTTTVLLFVYTVMAAPLILSMLSLRLRITVEMLGSVIPFYLFLPTLVAWFSAYSFARFWDLTWGNRPAGGGAAKAGDTALRSSYGLTTIIVLINLLLLLMFYELESISCDVGQAPVVIENPISATVVEGSLVQFVSRAVGDPTPTIQWERISDEAVQTIEGATESVLRFVATAALNNTEYRAAFENTFGDALSSAALLVVTAAADPAEAAGRIVGAHFEGSGMASVGGWIVGGALDAVLADPPVFFEGSTMYTNCEVVTATYLIVGVGVVFVWVLVQIIMSFAYFCCVHLPEKFTNAISYRIASGDCTRSSLFASIAACFGEYSSYTSAVCCCFNPWGHVDADSDEEEELLGE